MTLDCGDSSHIGRAAELSATMCNTPAMSNSLKPLAVRARAAVAATVLLVQGYADGLTQQRRADKRVRRKAKRLAERAKNSN